MEQQMNKPKILLVEDDAFLGDLCSKKLTMENMEVFKAINGQQALDILNKEDVSIILLDIILPESDGFEILEKIRNHKKESVKKTPVIILSNLGQKEDIEKAMKLGANDFMIKAHFTTSEIAQKIKNLLS